MDAFCHLHPHMQVFFLFFQREKSYMSANLRFLKLVLEEEPYIASRVVGYIARFALGEAISPWQAMYTGPFLPRGQDPITHGTRHASSMREGEGHV